MYTASLKIHHFQRDAKLRHYFDPKMREKCNHKEKFSHFFFLQFQSFSLATDPLKSLPCLDTLFRAWTINDIVL